MIIVVLTFLAVTVAIVIYTIYAFRFLALFIFLLLILIIYIKMRRDIHRYGLNSIFRAFHQYPKDNEQLNLVKHVLKKYKIKMNFLFELHSDILVGISQSGIYIVKVLDAVGRISGNLNDASLLLKNKETTVISNFFLELDYIEKNIKSKIKNVSINKIIVKKGTCLFEFSYSKDYLAVGMHNFYYQLQTLETEKKYSLEQVEQMNEILKNHLSKNVKLE